MNISHLLEHYTALFGTEPFVVRSPGRVNLIGEHTDYNEGFVLPAAIDKAVYLAIGKRRDHEIHLYSRQFDEFLHCHLSELRPVEEGWSNYILGVADQLQKRGYELGGFNLVIDGDVPLGAGLSSSAAVECATVFGLCGLFSLCHSEDPNGADRSKGGTHLCRGAMWHYGPVCIPVRQEGLCLEAGLQNLRV